MKAIEILDTPAAVTASTMYNIGAFTKVDLYVVDGQLVAFNGVATCMLGVVSIFDTIKVGESEPPINVAHNVSLTASDLLKAIAISQRPELAKELV